MMLLEDTPPTRVHSGDCHHVFRTRIGAESVVLKVLHSGAQSDAGGMLVREFDCLLEVSGPGVVRVLDLADSKAGCALVMVDAGPSNLATRLAEGWLLTAEFLDVAIQLALALARVHRAGYAHLGLRPDNAWRSSRRLGTSTC